MSDGYLDQSAIDELQRIYNQQIIFGGDHRVEYYETLSSYGIPYGELALGVVLDNTFSGQVANTFINFDSTKLSESQIVALSIDLFLTDVERRIANFETAKANPLPPIPLAPSPITSY